MKQNIINNNICHMYYVVEQYILNDTLFLKYKY